MRLLILALFLTGCGNYYRGHEGVQGQQGIAGAAGANGHDAITQLFSQTITCQNGGVTILTATDTNDNGYIDGTDSNVQALEVCNGVDGQDAQQSPLDIVAVVDPCGDAPGIQDEIFLRLGNGSLVASFSDDANGKNTHFAVLTPGQSYVTTDGSNCQFKVNADGSIQ